MKSKSMVALLTSVVLSGVVGLSGCDSQMSGDRVSQLAPAPADSLDTGMQDRTAIEGEPTTKSDETMIAERTVLRPNLEHPTSTAMLEELGQDATAHAQHQGTSDAKATEHQHAVVVLTTVGSNEVQGTIHLQQTPDGLHVHGEVQGLTPGKHGFHVHQFGDLSDKQNGKSAGGHFNPTNAQHGHLDDDERHAGDWGNIEANAQGVAVIDFVDKIAQLNGPQSVVGRSVVVHAGEDRFTQPVGDAGDRAAFGVIGVGNDEGKDGQQPQSDAGQAEPAKP